MERQREVLTWNVLDDELIVSTVPSMWTISAYKTPFLSRLGAENFDISYFDRNSKNL